MRQARGFLDFRLATGEALPAAPTLLLGVPVEGGGSRPGCSAAPDAIRRASGALTAAQAIAGVDLGNLPSRQGWQAPASEFVALSIGQGSVPVVLGGGPEVADITLGAAGALPVVAVSHVLRSCLIGRRVAWLGLNGPQPETLWKATIERSQSFATARQLEAGMAADLPDQAFLWIDAAVLDTGHAAGAAEVNPGGLAPDAMLRAIAPLRGRVSGIVITGATPGRDPRGLTELVLASAVQEVLRHG